MADYLNLLVDVYLCIDGQKKWVLGPGQVAPVMIKRGYNLRLNLYHIVEASGGIPCVKFGKLTWPGRGANFIGAGPSYVDADYARTVTREIDPNECKCGSDWWDDQGIQAVKALELITRSVPTMSGGMPSIFRRDKNGTRELYDVWSGKVVRCEKVEDYNPVRGSLIWGSEKAAVGFCQRAANLGKDLLFGWDQLDPTKVVRTKLDVFEFKSKILSGDINRFARKILLHSCSRSGQDEAVQMEFYPDTLNMLKRIGCDIDGNDLL